MIDKNTAVLACVCKTVSHELELYLKSDIYFDKKVITSMKTIKTLCRNWFNQSGLKVDNGIMSATENRLKQTFLKRKSGTEEYSIPENDLRPIMMMDLSQSYIDDNLPKNKNLSKVMRTKLKIINTRLFNLLKYIEEELKG